MKVLRARDLKRLMERDDKLLVINVLDQDSFEKEHIPGSHNIPNAEDDFVKQVERLAGGKNRPIVVYCASKDCTASPTAARKLVEAGFADVADFEGGMAEWKQLALEVESGTPTAAK